MRMRNLVNRCEVITFCTTPTQQLKTMDQAERTQESKCGSRARAEETPKQRVQRLARRREEDRERRARARAEETPKQREQRLARQLKRERRAKATARAFLWFLLLLGVLYLVLLLTSPLFARARGGLIIE